MTARQRSASGVYIISIKYSCVHCPQQILGHSSTAKYVHNVDIRKPHAIHAVCQKLIWPVRCKLGFVYRENASSRRQMSLKVCPLKTVLMTKCRQVLLRMHSMQVQKTTDYFFFFCCAVCCVSCPGGCSREEA